jgi:hypothetical protein
MAGNAGPLARLCWRRVWFLRPLQQQLIRAIPPALPVLVLLKRAVQAPLMSHGILLTEWSQEEDKHLAQGYAVGLPHFRVRSSRAERLKQNLSFAIIPSISPIFGSMVGLSTWSR